MTSNTKFFSPLLCASLLLASVFSAWASYLIHIVPLENMMLPILQDILDFEGRAPDQYRILPFLLIKYSHNAGLLITDGWLPIRYSVILFDALFLFLSACILYKHHRSIFSPALIWIFFLAFPYLMFDGYKPISSFLLFLCLMNIRLIQRSHARESYTGIMLAVSIVLLSFTRADVALLYALLIFGSTQQHIALKLFLLTIPIAVQVLLTEILFPDAEYFTNLIMLQDNLSLRHLLYAPPTYLIAALAIFYAGNIKQFLMFSFQHHRIICFACIGYVVTLFVIARPNEYRLFLPLLPILVLILDDKNKNQGVRFLENQGT